MTFNEYISNNKVFRIQDLLKSVSSKHSAKKQLKLALKSNKVTRIRQGLYKSNYGKFSDSNVAPSEIIYTLNNNNVLCYASALAEHGVSHNILNIKHFYSKQNIKDFSYLGMAYKCMPMPKNVDTQLLNPLELQIQTTSREQTIIDCIKKPQLAGGFENVVRSVRSFSYIDTEKLIKLLNDESIATVSKLGWLLELNKDNWNIDNSLINKINNRLGTGPYKFPNLNNYFWNKTWKLFLPTSKEEITQWL